MQRQSVEKQLAIGSIFGVVVAATRYLSNLASVLTPSGVGEIFGGVIGGAALYMLLYRLWPKKK